MGKRRCSKSLTVRGSSRLRIDYGRNIKLPEPKPEPPFEAQLAIIVRRAMEKQTPLPNIICVLGQVKFELELLNLQIQQAEAAKLQQQKPLIIPFNGRIPNPPER